MNIFGTKEIVFQGVAISVPIWVNYVWRDRDGSINGSQYEPFEDYHHGTLQGYYIEHGQSCQIHSPECRPVLQRV